MNKNYVPTPFDEQLQLETALTKTADFAGTTKDLGEGFEPGGVGMPMAAVVAVSAIDTTDANETYKFVLQESDDDATYTDAGPIVALTATGVFSIPGFVSKRYVRVGLDVGGTTPSVSYEAWLAPLGRPA